MFWLARGLSALILDWSKAEASKLYYFAFVLVTFNPTRCNGDFLTRFNIALFPTAIEFFCNFWLAHGLFALILIGQSNFLLLFLGYAIQSGAMVTFAHFFLRFPSATYFVTDCFLFVVFFVLIVIGQCKLLCFCSCDIQLKTVLRHSTYTHVLESLLNINEPYKKSLFYNVVIGTERKVIYTFH